MGCGWTPEQTHGCGQGRCAGKKKLTAERLNRLGTLTPGDFAAVARRLRLLGSNTAPEEYLGALEEDCAAKGGVVRPMGFVG